MFRQVFIPELVMLKELGQTVPNQRIIHCRSIRRPVVLSTLSGESYEVNITTANMGDSLKQLQ